MSSSVEQDLEFIHGANFYATFKLYKDERLKRYRGEYREDFLYKVGDGVKWHGEAWIAILESNRAEPGGPDWKAFWAHMTPLDLTGYSVLFKVEGVFEQNPSVDKEAGEIKVATPPEEFEAAPESARYFIKLTSESSIGSYPIRGTALFRQP